ncbi:hypothetical protein QE152_g1711 [Popillia japonica]|uniref:Transposase n=1 Tax=Popillia japonica TaxID=7064 RepID=A0AAW1N583_POPJA
MAYTLATRNHIKHPFGGNMADRAWLKLFLQRHKDLSMLLSLLLKLKIFTDAAIIAAEIEAEKTSTGALDNTSDEEEEILVATSTAVNWNKHGNSDIPPDFFSCA